MRRRFFRKLLLTPLEARDVPAVLVDRGDSYRHQGAPVPLVERADQVAVRIAGEFNPALTAPGGPLAGLNVVKELDGGLILEYAASPRSDAAEAIPANQRAIVTWSAPVFQVVGNHGYVIALDSIVVRLQPGVTAATFFASDSRFTSYERTIGTPDQFTATIAGTGRVSLQLAEEIYSDPRLIWSTPALAIESRLHSNDTLYSSQWHLNNTGQSGGVADSDIDAPEAWALTTGSANIVIADIDDAVQWSHPDLVGNVWSPPSEIAANSIDDDGNGWIDDTHGWDTYSNDNDPSPASGENHGTSTAGLAVAVGDNSLGVAGVAYSAKLMPIRSNIGPDLAQPDTTTAIYYAAGRTANGLSTWRGADILTCSWGFDAPYQPMTDAFTWASANGRGGKGLPIFVASGNAGTSTMDYPAPLAGSIPGFMAIGGSNHNDIRAGYSQYGPELDFMAPTRAGGGGGGIYTTDRTGSVGYSSTDYNSNFSGTSAATPIAAGVGALTLSMDPNLTSVQLRGLLRNTTDLIGPNSYGSTGFATEYGYGRVNAATAVQGVGTRKIQLLENNTVITSGSSTSTFNATTAAPQIKTYRIRNQGTLDLTLGSTSIAAGPFGVSTTFGDTTLSVGEATTFSVTFAPTTGGNFNSTLSFSTDDPTTPTFSFELSGTATDVSAPIVTAFSVGDGSVQRSRILSLGVTFSEVVTTVNGTPNAFKLSGPGGSSIPINVALPTVADHTEAQITFAAGTEFGSLVDGDYTLQVIAGQIRDSSNNTLSVTATYDFHRLFGDVDGDYEISLTDFAAFRSAFNFPSMPFDFDDSGAAGLADFAQFRNRFGL